MPYKNHLLLCLLLATLPAHALEQQFFSVKHTEYTPYMDDDGVLFPKDSVEFNTSSYRELLYASPDNKEFGIQISALLNDSNEFDQMRAMFNWGGFVMVAGSGSIEGDFKQTDEARLPGQQKPDELFQTMLPAKSSFKGKNDFFALGLKRGPGDIVGLAYTKYTQPVLLSVDTNQSYTFGFNSRTGKNENYHPEGTHPWEAIDAEGEIEFIGIWVRKDPMLASFAEVTKTQQADVGLFFGADIMAGFASYTPGKQVEEDYANGTEALATSLGHPGEGSALIVNSAESLLSGHLTYSTGLQGVWPMQNVILGLSGGVEGSINWNMFESTYKSGTYGAAHGDIKTEASSFSYGLFVRFAAAY
jgi:hypothetical protein